MSDDEFDDIMAQLRAEYLAEAPERLAAIKAAIDAFDNGTDDGDAAQRVLHQLTGSAGSYGFDEASALSRELEQWMKTKPPRSDDAVARLREGWGRLVGILT